MTHSWALREADLYDYNRTLDRIDDLRVDGNWLDEDGKPADVYVQRVSSPYLSITPPVRIYADGMYRYYYILSGGATDTHSR